jgi:hypothetical protein
MVNQLFSKFVQLRKCGDSSYLSIAENKKTLDLNEISALGDFSKLNTHSGNVVILTSAVVQTLSKHGKSTFFKICTTKKIWGIKLFFTSQNPFVL